MTALTVSVPTYNPQKLPAAWHKRPNFLAQHSRLVETGSKFYFHPWHLFRVPIPTLQLPGIAADPQGTVSTAALPSDFHPVGLHPAHPLWLSLLCSRVWPSPGWDESLSPCVPWPPCSRFPWEVSAFRRLRTQAGLTTTQETVWHKHGQRVWEMKVQMTAGDYL